jgi:hypothetical protein
MAVKLTEPRFKKVFNTLAKVVFHMAGDEEEAAAGIMDISDTPDVAVWAKGIGKGIEVPSDKVKQPSRISSMTLHVKRLSGAHNGKKEEEGGELMVDPANKEEMARVAGRHVSLTDESEYYAKQE